MTTNHWETKYGSGKESVEQVTSLLIEWTHGDSSALEKLIPLVYDELRRLASFYLNRERSDHTLSATALVHEAYLRLVNQKSKVIETRAHFFKVASHVMRCVLVDHARARSTAKRKGQKHALSLDERLLGAPEQDLALIALDDALTSLANFDPEKSQIVELRFFGGLSVDEVAEILGLSSRTVARQWALAKAWLYGEVRRHSPPEM